MCNAPEEEGRNLFRPFTRKSLAAVDEKLRKKSSKQQNNDTKTEEQEEDQDEYSKPNPLLAQGSLLPLWLRKDFPLNLLNKPLEDIDPFYKDQKTFILISKEYYIFRYDATDALWMLDPFNLTRRTALYIQTHSLFATFMIVIISINWSFLIMPKTSTIHTILNATTAIFTLEVMVKVIAKGFALRTFTYLRDPQNMLDFTLTLLAYTSIGPEIMGFPALRGIRLIGALGSNKKITSDMNIIIRSITTSLKNLGSAIVFTSFFVFVLAVSGLLHYMGVLTQKCVEDFPTDGSWGNLTDENWAIFVTNSSKDYVMSVCGNSSGAKTCKEGFTCLQGYGYNPDYGYTNFDTFWWASLSAFRLVTQDYWENLYQLVLSTAGPWNVLFFIFAIFFVSYYIQALILSVVTTTYSETLRKAAEEEFEYKYGKKLNATTERMKTMNGQKGIDIYLDAQKRLPYVDDSNAATPAVTPVIEESNGNAGAEFKYTADDTTAVNMKSKITNYFCIWDCWAPYVELQKFLSRVIFNPSVVLFLSLCIIIDTLLMTLHHHDMSINLQVTLASANYFFTAIFTVEVILKIIAMQPKFYFSDGWNLFEFIVISLSVLELGELSSIGFLCTFRTFRLLRVLKMARESLWPTMNLVISAMEAALPALSSLTIVFLTIVSILATIGMHMFGRNYIDNVDRFPVSVLPRWSFTDFLHSFMTVFRAICGEWIESMWDCLLVTDLSGLIFYLIVVLFGRFVIFNLFLALVLNNFGSSYTSTPANEDKLKRAFERISQGLPILTSKQSKLSTKVQISDEDQEEQLNQQHQQPVNTDETENADDSEKSGLNRTNTFQKENAKQLPDNDNADITVETLPNCFPEYCYKKSSFLKNDQQEWKNFRFKIFQLVENKYFEIVIRIMIIISSFALALEDIHLQKRPILHIILFYLDGIIVVGFFIEMLMRCLALGLWTYFRKPLCLLDFIIVNCIIIHFIALFCGFPINHILKTVRILRLLRVVKPIKGTKIVIDTLIQSIPSVLSALFFCVIIWLPFSILGVKLFAGKYFKCVDENGTKINFEIVSNFSTCEAENYTWKNSYMNFDNLGNAYFSLLQVATFKGWIEIMNDATDSRELDLQPIREVNIYMYMYFEVFVIIGSFFTLIMIAGVLLNNYNEQQRKVYGDANNWMTGKQKIYYNALRKIDSRKPVKAIPHPQWNLQAKVYAIVQSKEFEAIFMLFIGLNMVFLAMDYYQSSEYLEIVLDYANFVSIILFTIESLLKIFAFRFYYFKDGWNIFDFVIVALSLLSLVVTEAYLISTSTLALLRIVRVLKIGRLLYQIKAAKGIRILLSVTLACYPVIYNIVRLLFIIMFIFAIFGMHFFMNVAETRGLDDVFNFRSFSQSLLVLIHASTMAGWDGLLAAITNQNNCEMPNYAIGEIGTCGNPIVGTIFSLSYLFITYIIIAMYIPVVLWKYSEAKEEAEEGITEDDCNMFFEVWQKFDSNATQYIHRDQLHDFLKALGPPLQICQPEGFTPIVLDASTSADERVFYADVFHTVLEDFFVRRGNNFCKIFCDVQMQSNNSDFEYVSAVFQNQTEKYSSQLMQNMLRKHREQHSKSNEE